MSAEWVLGVAGTIIVILLGVVWWFFKRFVINDEGRISTTEMLMNQQDRISKMEVKLDIKLDAVHRRIDDIYEIVKDVLKRGKHESAS